jgi:hypothetical protein
MNGDSAPDGRADDAKKLATLLTASSSLRAKLFAKPTRVVGDELPSEKYWDYGSDEETPGARKKLAQETLEELATRIETGQLSSTINTDGVFEDYFRPISKAVRLTFFGILTLSALTFALGLGLVVAGVWIAVDPPATATADPTVTAVVFGGTGALSALGSLYALTLRGITGANTRHARLQLVLTGFATELGQLRAVAESQPGVSPALTLDSIKVLNEEVRKSTHEALGLIPAEADDPAHSNGPPGPASPRSTV